MNVKLSFRPPRTIKHDTLETLVEWEPVQDAVKYQVTISYGRFKVPAAVTTVDAGQPLAVRHVIQVPNVQDGTYPVTATVEPQDGQGQPVAPAPGTQTEQIAVGPWLTPGFVYAIKKNFDDVMDKHTDSVAEVGKQLQTANDQGIRLRRATSLPADPARDAFWQSIRTSTKALSFNNYKTFIDNSFGSSAFGASTMRMPFSQVDAYLRLKALTELFLLSNVGVIPGANPRGLTATTANALPDATTGIPNTSVPAATVMAEMIAARPYLQTVLAANSDLTSLGSIDTIGQRLRYPVLIELMWSYWHEEAMQVQTLHKIKWRFQNRSEGTGRDPLAQFEMDPLRPLNNILWGWIQDEQHRLSVRQRAYEYSHHYGLALEGKAIGRLQPADNRSRFLQSFHNLLQRAVEFFAQSDDTTVVANGSPLLYALRDLQWVLAEGAHNQFGDLPWNARLEMLMEQWILSRPEIHDFLRGRRMVPYPEAWMASTDAMKTLQGWTPTSVVHFHDLGTFGEQLLLSVREGGVPGTGSWGNVPNADEAAAWALQWRSEIEGYIHAYRAATSIDLASNSTDPRYLADRDTPPSVHLRRKIVAEAVG